MPRRDGIQSRAIKPGDAGIWATCAMKKEAKSVSDLRDLFQEVSEILTSHHLRATLLVMLISDSTLPRCMGRLDPTGRLQKTVLILKGAISKLRSRKSSPIFVSRPRSYCSHLSSSTPNAVRIAYHASDSSG
jgi:hypothetical protein